MFGLAVTGVPFHIAVADTHIAVADIRMSHPDLSASWFYVAEGETAAGVAATGDAFSPTTTKPLSLPSTVPQTQQPAAVAVAAGGNVEETHVSASSSASVTVPLPADAVGTWTLFDQEGSEVATGNVSDAEVEVDLTGRVGYLQFTRGL